MPFFPHLSVCSPPTKPENGGYVCHPSPCQMFSHGTVIEFVCDEGFAVTGDYNYLVCEDGEWDSPMQTTCTSKGLAVLYKNAYVELLSSGLLRLNSYLCTSRLYQTLRSAARFIKSDGH